MKRVFNFSAGPAVLPEAVLAQVQREIFDWGGSGISVMEMSHRGKEFTHILEKAVNDLRELANIPADYDVLFLQGGATAQFSMIPMNLLSESGTADYVNTGQWSTKAIKEASKFCNVNVAASSEDRSFNYIPAFDEWNLDKNASYVHITTNETIGGVEFHWTPDVGSAPLVTDMSSHFLSRPIDIEKYGLIYAGAQKNVGPAGLTIVIIKKDLVGISKKKIPLMYDYKVYSDSGSTSNTPPCFAIYVAGLVFEWLKTLGGLKSIERLNIKKAEMLYDFIDSSGFYLTPVEKKSRSRMNIPFIISASGLNDKFLVEAKEHDLCNLKGHRSVGGMRASIYNAMPSEGVTTLIDFMKYFERKHG